MENDTIYRQDAIDALYKEIIKRRLLGDDYDGMLDEFATEEVLKKVPSAQQVDKDINVPNTDTISRQEAAVWEDKELPSESGMYIVTAHDGVKKRVTFVKYQKRLKQWDLTGARAYWRIIAWMPLPEPYRGDGNG